MTRFVLPILTIVASLHRCHALLNCAALPPTFGVTRSRAAGSLAATRKDAADNTKEIGDDDSYTPAPWEDELNCVINKKRLEQAWVGRMIRSKTRFLSYEKCSAWAHGQNMWDNKSEWADWISMGECKPSIVPSNPERHYRNQGTWISWEDFLGVALLDPDSMDGAGI